MWDSWWCISIVLCRSSWFSLCKASTSLSRSSTWSQQKKKKRIKIYFLSRRHLIFHETMCDSHMTLHLVTWQSHDIPNHTKTETTCSHLVMDKSMGNLTSFPGLHIFYLSVCIQYNTRKRKSDVKRGRPGNTYHMNDVRWTSGGRKVDMGGEGGMSPHPNNTLDFIIERPVARQDPRHPQDCE